MNFTPAKTWFYPCQVGRCTSGPHWILLLVWLQNWYLQEEKSSAGRGRSFVANSSISLPPPPLPPQETLQCKTSERKYYSGTLGCTSQCLTERLLARTDTAFVQETLFSIKYGDGVCFRSHAQISELRKRWGEERQEKGGRHRPPQALRCTTPRWSLNWSTFFELLETIKR